MGRRKLPVVLTVVTICGVSAGNARASTPFAAVDNGWRVSIGYLHQNYREYNSGLNSRLTVPVIDGERGAFGVISLILRHSTPGLYSAFTLRYAAGRDVYSGYACGADGCIPATSHTGNNILATSFEIGPAVDGRNWRLVPYLVLGALSWYRDIAGTPAASGSVEQYGFDYGGVGVLLQRALTPRVLWSFAVQVGRTIRPRMRIDRNSVPLQMDLGSNLLWHARMGVDIGLGGPWWLSSGLSYTRFRFGVSSVYAADGLSVQEPASRTQQWSYRVGLGRHF
ncbi:MAG: hypothetical protein ACYCXT_02330 [Acidiferrobacteraceae bacterium]